MTPEQLKEERAKLNKTQKEMAELLRVNARTYEAWEVGKYKVPPSIELLINLLQKVEKKRK